MTYVPSFNEGKTAQLAAYFTSKSGGEIYQLMLMKLLYISDRNVLSTLGYTISDDNYASMNYGHVLLNTLSLIDGSIRSSNGLWSQLLLPSHNYKIALRSKPPVKTDLLSQAELEIADSVYEQFGEMDRFALADKTHEFGEWKNPYGSTFPIDYRDILIASGFDKKDAESILQEL